MTYDAAWQHSHTTPSAISRGSASWFIADMAVEVERARWMVYRAASLADDGQEFAKEAAMAKLFCSEGANRAASPSLQIDGGCGYITESEVSKFHSDAKILEIGDGTGEIQRNVIAYPATRESAAP